MSISDIAPTCVKRDPPKTPQQCAAIALAEYEYWRTQERIDENITAMAAAANIYAAITEGMMAPWHPKTTPQPDVQSLTVAKEYVRGILEDPEKCQEALQAGWDLDKLEELSR